jgi:hypothetical protein
MKDLNVPGQNTPSSDVLIIFWSVIMSSGDILQDASNMFITS